MIEVRDRREIRLIRFNGYPDMSLVKENPCDQVIREQADTSRLSISVERQTFKIRYALVLSNSEHHLITTVLLSLMYVQSDPLIRLPSQSPRG